MGSCMCNSTTDSGPHARGSPPRQQGGASPGEGLQGARVRPSLLALPWCHQPHPAIRCRELRLCGLWQILPGLHQRRVHTPVPSLA